MITLLIILLRKHFFKISFWPFKPMKGKEWDDCYDRNELTKSRNHKH